LLFSHGLVGWTHLSKIFDSVPVVATKLLIGVIEITDYLGILESKRLGITIVMFCSPASHKP
jgi:hypothetical protein